MWHLTQNMCAECTCIWSECVCFHLHSFSHAHAMSCACENMCLGMSKCVRVRLCVDVCVCVFSRVPSISCPHSATWTECGFTCACDNLTLLSLPHGSCVGVAATNCGQPQVLASMHLGANTIKHMIKCARARAFMSTCECACACVCVQACMRMRACTCVCACVCICVCVCRLLHRQPTLGHPSPRLSQRLGNRAPPAHRPTHRPTAE